MEELGFFQILWNDFKPLIISFLIVGSLHLITAIEQVLPQNYRWITGILRAIRDAIVANSSSKIQETAEELAKNVVRSTHELLANKAGELTRDQYAELSTTEAVKQFKDIAKNIPAVKDISDDTLVVEQLVRGAWRAVKTEDSIPSLEFLSDTLAK